MSLFTIRPETQIDHHIQQDLDCIVSAINTCDAEYDAIYLIGSFGRGEGAVRFDGEQWRGINDYDLVIITSEYEGMRPCCERLSGKLARSLQIDFVDLMCLRRASLPELAPTMQNYDFKYGSLLVAGQDVLPEAPNFQPGYLPPYEFVRLLCNRSAGLLTARLPEHSGCPSYCANQFLKACIAVGDIAVYLVQGYHHSYCARSEAFHSLASEERLPFELPEAAVDAVHEAYETKLEGLSSIPFSVDEQLMRLMIAKAYCAIAARCTGRDAHSISWAERALVNHYRKGNNRRQRIRRKVRAYRHRDISHVIGICYLVLFAQPFFYCHFQSSRLLCAIKYVRRFGLVPGALKQKWNALSAVKLWEKFCH